MTPKRPYSLNKKKESPNLFGLGFVVVGFLVIVFLLSLRGEGSETSPLQLTSLTTQKKGILSGTLEYSVYGDGKSVPYYYCNSSKKNEHVVLLHGARFTKEDWKSSGILDKLCANTSLSVSAMDLPVQAGHRDLIAMLSSLSKTLKTQQPVALVTPSASGMTITDWMATGQLNELPKHVKTWIPVAAGSVLAATEDQLQRMDRLQNFNVLAIFGDRDKMGKQTTMKLQEHIGATEILELQGGHPCYLDSPLDFCGAIFKELGVQ